MSEKIAKEYGFVLRTRTNCFLLYNIILAVIFDVQKGRDVFKA